MLDDFLNDDDEITTFLDELEEDYDEVDSGPQPGFLGMTPFQRFVVSLLFFLMVVVAGSFCLLITGSISFPF